MSQRLCCNQISSSNAAHSLKFSKSDLIAKYQKIVKGERGDFMSAIGSLVYFLFSQHTLPPQVHYCLSLG